MSTREMNPLERRIMAILTRRGHYPETPDAFEWAQDDAELIAYCLDEYGGHDEILAALLDLGVHDPTAQDEADCLAGDIHEILACYSDPRVP